jgi:hypothetical protein
VNRQSNCFQTHWLRVQSGILDAFLRCEVASMDTQGRSVDIELNNQEVITVDLDNLDPDPQDVIDLLGDGHPKVWVWTKVAAEYWNKGYVDAAEKIAQAAIISASIPLHDEVGTTGTSDHLIAAQEKNDTSTLPPIYALLANIQIVRARKAPKLILADACERSDPSLSDDCLPTPLCKQKPRTS